MFSDPIVVHICNEWKIDPSLIQSIIKTEGGNAALIRAIRIGVPLTNTFEKAVNISCRTVCHRMMDYVSQDKQIATDFIKFLGNTWAPIGASNDPTNLNKNWVPNVLKFWGRGE